MCSHKNEPDEPRLVQEDAAQNVGKPESQDSQPRTGTQPVSDPFADLSKLRLSQDFAATVGVKKLLTTVPVRKPNGQEFVRVHPGEEYRLQTAVLELKVERETYLVASELWAELPGELSSPLQKWHFGFLQAARVRLGEVGSGTVIVRNTSDSRL